MNSQFKKGVLEFCVLAVVAKQDIYGYELVQQISENINITDGTIYPLLRRLTNEGYFATYLQESAAGPPRKYYKITPEGQKQLDELLKDWTEFTAGVSRLLAANKEGNSH